MTNSIQQSKVLEQAASGSDVMFPAQAGDITPNGGGTAIAEKVVDGAAQGDVPRQVIRGESLWQEIVGDDGENYLGISIGGRYKLIHLPKRKEDIAPYSAITDYLNCTFPFKKLDPRKFFLDLTVCLGSKFYPISDRGRGIHGWSHSFTLGETSALFGLGGQNDTGFLSFPGEACHMVPNWKRLVRFLNSQLKARITRWDGAVDDYAGTHSVDWAVELYMKNQFNSGGNRPQCNQTGSWLIQDGRGRTFYVGNRKNGKIVRIYEKGMQLGAKFHPWVRWEVEMHNKDRIIPWEVLLEPGKYVAGAYPNALGWIHEDMQRIKTIKKSTKINYDNLISYLKNSYGKHLNVMMHLEGSPNKVLEKLVMDGIPKRLVIPDVPEGEGK